MATKTNTTINGQNYFRITRTVDHKYVDGKLVAVKKQFLGKSKSDAEAKYRAFLQDRIDKKEAAIRAATFHDRAEEYITNALEVSQKYSTGTKIRYKSAYDVHIKGSRLDRMKLSEIRASDIQKFYNDLDVSLSTLKQVNRFMSAFYKWLVRNEYASDVLSAVELPAKRDTKKSEDIVTWDDATWDLLTTADFDFRHDFLIKLMSYTGMRIGECLGLKYSDIYDGEIHVVRQYSMGEIKPPKYKSSRQIPMHDKVAAGLVTHRTWHEAEMLANGYETDYIFTTSSGKLIDVTNLHRAFKRFYARNGIEPKHFHVYRATFCTKMLEAGVPLETASKILGHKNMDVTAAHYALVSQDMKRDAINKLK